jgi:hypothetical protein
MLPADIFKGADNITLGATRQDIHSIRILFTDQRLLNEQNNSNAGLY